MINLDDVKISNIRDIDIIFFHENVDGMFYNPSWRDSFRVFISDFQNTPMKCFKKESFGMSWPKSVENIIIN